MTDKSSIPPDKQVNHLILLVGGNPLPNAVAGSLLLQADTSKPRIISLIHSVDTEPIAKRLCTFFQDQPSPPQVCLFGPDKAEGLAPLETSPELIKEYVQQADAAARKQDEQAIESTGLNYTGGTKAMSLYAFAALEKRKPILSYLDARTHTMHFDPKLVNQPFVGNALDISLESLLALTKWELRPAKTAFRTATLLPDLVYPVVNYVCQQRPRGLQHEEIKAYLQSHLPEPLKNKPTKEQVQAYGFATLEDFNKWINGGFWLEDYVFDILTKHSSLCLHDCRINVVPYLQGGSDDNKFELDVVAMIGYQLFIFSCAAMSPEKSKARKELKLKLIEAELRARQLGGDEARVALVCFYDQRQAENKKLQRQGNPDGYEEEEDEIPNIDLEDEVNAEIAQKGKVKVFGRKDLMHNRFPQRVTEWIKEQSKI